MNIEAKRGLSGSDPSEKCGGPAGVTVGPATGGGGHAAPPSGNLRITQHFTFAVQCHGAHRGECVCGYEGPARPTWSGAERDLARHLYLRSQLIDVGRYGVMRVRADGSYSFLGAL